MYQYQNWCCQLRTSNCVLYYIAFFLCYGIEGDNVAVLLPLAREYQIDGLTQHCEQFLLSREPSVRSLVLADEFSLQTLKKKCLDYANRLQLLSTLVTNNNMLCMNSLKTYLYRHLDCSTL